MTSICPNEASSHIQMAVIWLQKAAQSVVSRTDLDPVKAKQGTLFLGKFLCFVPVGSNSNAKYITAV